jgi:hypothetical protein
MAKRYAENGWKLGGRFYELEDNGIRGRDGYTLIMELADKRIKFHLDGDALARCVKTVKRGLFIVLAGTVDRSGTYLRYKVHRITVAKDETEAQANWARLSGTVTIQGPPRKTCKDRDKCSLVLTTAGTQYALVAYDDNATTVATLKAGDEVALDMHFITTPVNPVDPESKHRLRLEIDTIAVEPHQSGPQAPQTAGQ